MKMKMKRKAVVTIIILIIATLTAILVVSINAGKRYDIVSPEGDVVIKEEDVLSSLKSSAKLLRKDKQEVVASVDGIEITAHTLNLYRTSKSLSDRGIEFTEKDLIMQIAENLIIEKIVLEETGYSYDNKLPVEPDSDEDKVYAEAAGLSVSEYNEMHYIVDKYIKVTSRFTGHVFTNIDAREGAFKDPQYDEYYESYQKAIEEGNVNRGTEILMEIYDFYVQQLIKNADIKIY